MKKSIKKLKVFYQAVILSIAITVFASPCLSAPVKKIAVFPIQMNSAQDLSFLQKGLFSMLSSRLADPGKVEILEREIVDNALSRAQSFPLTKGSLNESKARLIGKNLGVDYVLFGSLTMFGKSVSLDMSMLDIKSSTSTLTFSRQEEEPGAVITELDKIAEEINLKVFGRETLEFQSRKALAMRYSQEGEVYANPLKKFQTLLNVKGILNGVVTGDIDNDKKNEIVVILDRTVQILEYTFGGKVHVVQEFGKNNSTMSLVSVDIADINQNGFQEIFITAINNTNQSVSSYIIEYDGSKYKIGGARYPWYFRVVHDEQGNSELFAQVHTKKGPWASNKVFKVDWLDNSYTPGRRLKVPERGFSVLSMTTGKTFSKETSMYLYTDKLGRLTFFNDATGRIEWASDKGYGGSKLFYSFPKTAHGLYDNRYEFFQPKSIIYDIDSDGKSELFVIKNIEASDYLFANTRVYKKGSIEILNWNEMGLSYENTPKKIAGQVTSIEIGDYDNDSKMELLVAMIKKRSDMFAKNSNSILVAYEIEQ